MKYPKIFSVLIIFFISLLISFLLITYEKQIIFSKYVPSDFNIRYSLWLFMEILLLPRSLADMFGMSCGMLGCIDFSPVLEYPAQAVFSFIFILILYRVFKSKNIIAKRVLIGLFFILLVCLFILPFYLQKQCVDDMLKNEKYYSSYRQKVPNEYFSNDYIRNNGKVIITKGDSFHNSEDIYEVLKNYGILSVEKDSVLNVKIGDEFIVSCSVPAYTVMPLVREWKRSSKK